MTVALLSEFPRRFLIYLIIDYSYSDQPTLAACSLVYKAWLSSTRYHLFSTVNLSRESMYLFAFLELLESTVGYHTTLRS